MKKFLILLFFTIIGLLCIAQYQSQEVSRSAQLMVIGDNDLLATPTIITDDQWHPVLIYTNEDSPVTLGIDLTNLQQVILYGQTTVPLIGSYSDNRCWASRVNTNNLATPQIGLEEKSMEGYHDFGELFIDPW